MKRVLEFNSSGRFALLTKRHRQRESTHPQRLSGSKAKFKCDNERGFELKEHRAVEAAIGRGEHHGRGIDMKH